MVKNLPASAGETENRGWSPGSGKIPGGGHSNQGYSNIPWKIPWTEEPGGLQSMGSQRVTGTLYKNQEPTQFSSGQKGE